MPKNPVQTTLVVSAEGEVRAATGRGRDLWSACGREITALARRAIANREPEAGKATGAGGAWDVVADPGTGTDGRAVAVVRFEPVVNDEWSASGDLDGERYRALCRLVSGAVHELRNPLASISLIAEILGQRSELDESVRERLLDVIQHVERSEELLQNFRRFSQEEHGARGFLSLNDLVGDAVRLERRSLTAAGIELALNLDPGLPSVLADPSQLRLVVANLIRNAAESILESSSAGGQIQLETSHNHGVVRLKVEDDGPGIESDVITTLFEPRVTTKAAGTGLGLAMSAGVAKAHGGHIWVDEACTTGARFYLDLPDPALATPAWNDTALGIELTQGPSHAALVVDWDAARREGLQAAIASIGWKVHVAANAEGALRKLRASDFDVVLVDARDDRDKAVDLCARSRLLYPELAGRMGVIVPADPDGETVARLRLAGARYIVAPDADGLVAFACDLAGLEAELAG